MIGEPTNFVHTTHVGSGDMGLASVSFLEVFFCPRCSHQYPADPCELMFTLSHHQVDLVQAQMKSKGGYAHGGSEGSQL